MVDEPEEIPTVRDLLTEQLGIDLPSDIETIGGPLWTGLAPHLFDLLAIAAAVRVGLRWPDMSAGIAGAAGDFVTETLEKLTGVSAAVSGPGIDAIIKTLPFGGFGYFQWALDTYAQKLTEAREEVKTGGDPCLVLEAALRAATSPWERRAIAEQLAKCKETHTLEGEPSSAGKMALFRERVEVQLDVVAVSILGVYFVRHFKGPF